MVIVVVKPPDSGKELVDTSFLSSNGFEYLEARYLEFGLKPVGAVSLTAQHFD
jgi:hypothetical protein